jgi:hypothetical protein
VPVALVLVAGTLFHWMNGLHHFTEHMRHRRRVHELEAELATLRAHLDQVLEMPAVSSSKQVPRKETPALLPEANGGLDDMMANEPEPVVAEANGGLDQIMANEPEAAVAEAEPAVETLPASVNNSKKSRKRVSLEFGDVTPAKTELSPEKEP